MIVCKSSCWSDVVRNPHIIVDSFQASFTIACLKMLNDLEDKSHNHLTFFRQWQDLSHFLLVVHEQHALERLDLYTK